MWRIGKSKCFRRLNVPGHIGKPTEMDAKMFQLDTAFRAQNTVVIDHETKKKRLFEPFVYNFTNLVTLIINDGCQYDSWTRGIRAR